MLTTHVARDQLDGRLDLLSLELLKQIERAGAV